MDPGTRNTCRPPTVVNLCRLKLQVEFQDEEVFCHICKVHAGEQHQDRGMICEHFQPILESDRDSCAMSECSLPEVVCPLWPSKLCEWDAQWSAMCFDGLLQGQSKQYAVAAEKATALFQCALRTRAGCECVAHVLQTFVILTRRRRSCLWTEWEHSRNAMLMGLFDHGCGDPSICLWEDDFGGVHSVFQGEGGEQGDPLMPMLFSLGQHAPLMAFAGRLQDGEKLLAFLDDLHIVTSPGRTVEVHNILCEEPHTESAC